MKTIRLHWALLCLFSISVSAASRFTVAPFSADVTVPIGHGMMGGYWKAKSVVDPLYAMGVVLSGGDKPVVFVSVDWCEIRNAWSNSGAPVDSAEVTEIREDIGDRGAKWTAQELKAFSTGESK